MAFDAKFKYYLINPSTGNFYTATQDEVTGDWTVTESATQTPINNLPDGWDSLELHWMRHVDYMGVFRSFSGNMTFSEDGRGIINSLFTQYGSQAQCVLRIDMWKPDYTYETVYKCYLNFEKYIDSVNFEKCTIGTLDSGLYSRLELNSSNDFMIKYWDRVGDTEAFTTDAVACLDQGIGLLFNARFTDGASSTNPTSYTVGGAVGTRHTVLSLANSQIVPYIGNEILRDFVKIGQQILSENATTFDNYSQNSYLIKNLIDPGVNYMKPVWTCRINSISYPNPPVGDQRTLRVIISEVDNTNTIVTEYNFFDITIDNNPGSPTDAILTLPSFAIVDNSPGLAPPFTTITLLTQYFNFTYDRVYVLNFQTSSLSGTGIFGITTTFYENLFYLTSKKMYALPDTDLRFPESTYIGFRPHQVLEKIVPMLNSNSVDAVGFPLIPSDTTFTGRSDYLSDPSVTLADNYDNIPYNTLFTSDTAVRLLPGQQYMTMSLDSLHQIAFSQWSCGMGIENDTDGNPTVIRIEPLTYFFDKDTELFDLGFNIGVVEITPLMDYICGTIKTGYSTKWQDFSQYIGNNLNFFGSDAFNIEQEYKPPFIAGIKKVLDMSSKAVAEPLKKETARSQSKTPSTSPGDSNTSNVTSSAGNDTYMVEIQSGIYDTYEAKSPPGYTETIDRYKPIIYPSASDSDPLSPPYVRGLHFPEKMQNLGLTPAKNMLRNGKFLRAICSGQDAKNIAFQKQYWNLYNGNVSIDVSGIATNLNSGLITEVADIPVGDLPDRLFNPKLLKFTTEQPVNMWQIMNTSSRGYISARIRKPKGYGFIQIKGFIWEVSQNLGNKASTTFTLLAHPDMTI